MVSQIGGGTPKIIDSHTVLHHNHLTWRIDHGASGEGDGYADEDADEIGAKSDAHHRSAGDDASHDD